MSASLLLGGGETFSGGRRAIPLIVGSETCDAMLPKHDSDTDLYYRKEESCCFACFAHVSLLGMMVAAEKQHRQQAQDLAPRMDV